MFSFQCGSSLRSFFFSQLAWKKKNFSCKHKQNESFETWKKKGFSWVTSSNQHYKQYFPDRPCSDSSAAAKTQPEEELKITICKRTIFSPPNNSLWLCLRRRRLCVSQPPLAVSISRRHEERLSSTCDSRDKTNKQTGQTKTQRTSNSIFYRRELRIAAKRKDNKQTLWVDNKPVALCCCSVPDGSPPERGGRTKMPLANAIGHRVWKHKRSAGGERPADDNLLISLPLGHLEQQPQRRYFNLAGPSRQPLRSRDHQSIPFSGGQARTHRRQEVLREPQRRSWTAKVLT